MISFFKFGNKEIASRDFYMQKQVTDKFRINVSKVVAPDREDWWYTVSDQVDGERVMPVFINTLKNIFSYGVSKYDKKLADTMRFSVTEVAKHLE